jgi:uncharacterized protein
MSVRIRRYSNPGAFLARVGDWLLREEAENNLPIGIVRRLVDGRVAYEPPLYLAVVEDAEGAVRGCAIRTPPHNLLVTRFGLDANAALCTDVAGVYSELPGVLGPEDEASAFASRWREIGGGEFEVAVRLGIYRLARVRQPARTAAGRLRKAELADVSLIAAWIRAFAKETHTPTHHTSASVQARIEDGEFFVWEDDGPRSMTAISGQTPNGARVGYVYTPPELRRRGYASAAVAALTQRILEDGFRFCFLFADPENPTANRIYSDLGYERIGEHAEVRIEHAAGSSW